jgi:4-hydroxy-tetrahydrodipicolinate reductase
MPPLRVISFGLGPIGVATAKLALAKESLQLVGAIDVAPALRGQDLGAVLELGRATGILVSDDARASFAELRPDAILHCTSSFLPAVKEQLMLAAAHGIDVVSSTEELLVPDLQHAELARELDAAAKSGGATILGTGVNPGYAMDTLAVVATAACHSVEKVECRRVVDAATRRLPLQRKVGAGMTEEAFRRELATGRFGHIGLRESIALVGRACGWALDPITQSVEPVIAERDETTPFLVVRKGQVAGIWNRGSGREGGRLRVEMDLRMFVGAADPVDEVRVTGEPAMHLRIEGGTPGDVATSALLVNMLPRVVAARPGLVTMLDLPLPGIVR